MAVNNCAETIENVQSFRLIIATNSIKMLPIPYLPPAHFWKTAGGIILGSVAVSAVSVDVLPYISVAIKA